jgi:hypothetical protein
MDPEQLHGVIFRRCACGLGWKKLLAFLFATCVTLRVTRRTSLCHPPSPLAATRVCHSNTAINHPNAHRAHAQRCGDALRAGAHRRVTSVPNAQSRSTRSLSPGASLASGGSGRGPFFPGFQSSATTASADGWARSSSAQPASVPAWRCCQRCWNSAAVPSDFLRTPGGGEAERRCRPRLSVPPVESTITRVRPSAGPPRRSRK